VGSSHHPMANPTANPAAIPAGATGNPTGPTAAVGPGNHPVAHPAPDPAASPGRRIERGPAAGRPPAMAGGFNSARAPKPCLATESAGPNPGLATSPRVATESARPTPADAVAGCGPAAGATGTPLAGPTARSATLGGQRTCGLGTGGRWSATGRRFRTASPVSTRAAGRWPGLRRSAAGWSRLRSCRIRIPSRTAGRSACLRPAPVRFPARPTCPTPRAAALRSPTRGAQRRTWMARAGTRPARRTTRRISRTWVGRRGSGLGRCTAGRAVVAVPIRTGSDQPCVPADGCGPG